MQVCINSSFDCDSCAGSEIFLLGLQVAYVNTLLQDGRYQHTDTQFSFIQILFHKIELYASVGRYSFSTMVIIQDIQTVCMSTLIYPSFHQILIILLCNGSFTTKASCQQVSSSKYLQSSFWLWCRIYLNLTWQPLKCAFQGFIKPGLQDFKRNYKHYIIC